MAGLIISLDNLTDDGVRNNWCNTKKWWTNNSIQFAGTQDNATARVGDNVTIQVEIRALTEGLHLDGDVECQVTSIQAWICYPNTVAGNASVNLIVHSMNPTVMGRTLPPSLIPPPESPLIVFTNPSFFDPGNSTGFKNLNPMWKPTQDDILPPNLDAHACIVATCAGLIDINGPTFSVGTRIFNDNLSLFNICNDPHQGQRNIAILHIGLQRLHLGPLPFGFISGLANQDRGRTRITISAARIPPQDGRIEPVTHAILATSAAYGDLPLKPSPLPLKNIKLRHNHHKCTGWLEEIVGEAEEIIEDVVDDLERLIGCDPGDKDGKGTKLHVTIPAEGSGFVPLLFEVELGEGEEEGNVHVFDLVQTNGDLGETGGCRVAVVVTP
jgi:hypothetical protein